MTARTLRVLCVLPIIISALAIWWVCWKLIEAGMAVGNRMMEAK